MKCLFLAWFMGGVSWGFQPMVIHKQPQTRLEASGKGFGKETTVKKTAPSPTTANSELLAQLLQEEADRKVKRKEEVEDLAVRDQFVLDNRDAGRIPDAVSNRMALRMAVFGGVPTFGGIGLFVYFYFLATQQDNVFEPTQVAAFTTAPWVLGLLGIGYGALSASWDDEENENFLGITEFQINLKRISEGLKRSARDANLRDSEYRRDRQLKKAAKAKSRLTQ